MDISIIQGRPPGRKPVTTQVVWDDDAGKQLMYDMVRKEVATGKIYMYICEQYSRILGRVALCVSRHASHKQQCEICLIHVCANLHVIMLL